MGKLYDRRDLDFDLCEIDKLESRLSIVLAAGRGNAISFAALDKYGWTDITTGKDGRQRCKTLTWDGLRNGARMRLLATGALIRDLRAAEARFNAAPTHTNKRVLGLIKTRVHWAGIYNLERRERLGVPWADDVGPEVEHDGACNDLERKFFDDRRRGAWPFEESGRCYGAGYSGWLHWQLHRDGADVNEVRQELARLQEET